MACNGQLQTQPVSSSSLRMWTVALCQDISGSTTEINLAVLSTRSHNLIMRVAQCKNVHKNVWHKRNTKRILAPPSPPVRPHVAAETAVTLERSWRRRCDTGFTSDKFNPLNPELNPICYSLALLAHHFLHVSRIRVKSLTLRLLMSYIYLYIYIYGAPILGVSRSYTTTQHSQ